MENSKNEEVATKKQKVDNIEIDTVLYTKILQSFKLVKVLSEDAHQKNIFVHGKVMVDSKFGGFLLCSNMYRFINLKQSYYKKIII